MSFKDEILQTLFGGFYLTDEDILNAKVRIEKYIAEIDLIDNKEDIKIIVRKMFEDIELDDIDFNEIIYDYIIPKLKKMGVDMNYNEESKETNYERIIKENY